MLLCMTEWGVHDEIPSKDNMPHRCGAPSCRLLPPLANLTCHLVYADMIPAEGLAGHSGCSAHTKWRTTHGFNGADSLLG
jgi:hypothetical protein